MAVARQTPPSAKDASGWRGSIGQHVLVTLLTKGDGGRDGVFGFPKRALAGLGWMNFR
jgi:hypothetical protein